MEEWNTVAAAAAVAVMIGDAAESNRQRLTSEWPSNFVRVKRNLGVVRTAFSFSLFLFCVYYLTSFIALGVSLSTSLSLSLTVFLFLCISLFSMAVSLSISLSFRVFLFVFLNFMCLSVFFFPFPYLSPYVLPWWGV